MVVELMTGRIKWPSLVLIMTSLLSALSVTLRVTPSNQSATRAGTSTSYSSLLLWMLWFLSLMVLEWFTTCERSPVDWMDESGFGTSVCIIIPSVYEISYLLHTSEYFFFVT